MGRTELRDLGSVRDCILAALAAPAFFALVWVVCIVGAYLCGGLA